MDLKKLLVEENVGGYDLFLRAFLGSASIVLLALGDIQSPWSWMLGLTAFIGLFSGMSRHCTPYALLGYSTAEKK